MHPTRYDECQILADLARGVGIELIKYASVRDPHHRPSLAILSCRAFAHADVTVRQTWRILLGANGARAICEMPSEGIDFPQQAFEADPRSVAMRWDR
jgi:hypothetical protein